MKTGFGSVHDADHDVKILQGLFQAVIAVLTKQCFLFGQILLVHDGVVQQVLDDAEWQDEDGDGEERKVDQNEKDEAIEKAETPVQRVISSKASKRQELVEDEESSGSWQDVDQEQEFAKLLKVAFMYNIISPKGIVQQLSPLIRGTELTAQEMADPMIRNVMDMLPEYTRMSRHDFVQDCVQMEEVMNDQDKMMQLYTKAYETENEKETDSDSESDSESFVHFKEYPDGEIRCDCPFCHDYFDLYEKYTTVVQSQDPTVIQEMMTMYNIGEFHSLLLKHFEKLGDPIGNDEI